MNQQARGGAATSPREQAGQSLEALPRWNVVLLDDDNHTYEYVMEMVQGVFGRSRPDAYLVAKQVDTDKRAVCCTTHREHAELKREQMLSFGRDPRIASSAGPMSVILEPAWGDAPDDAPGGRAT